MEYNKFLLVVHISYVCTQNCVFCSESSRLKKFRGKFVNKSTIFYLLEKWYERGIRQVHFTGGEPFLHPNIFEILGFAKKIGYKVNILTNGVVLEKEEVFVKSIRYLDGIDLSVHGFNKEICFNLTGNKNNYKSLKNLFKLIVKYNVGSKFFINTVVLKDNIFYLEKIYNFVLSHFRPKFYLFSYLAPEGKGATIFKDGFVDFRKFNCKLKDIFKKQDGVPKVIIGVPLCELDGEMKQFSNDLYFSPRITIEIDRITNGKVYLREVLTKKPIRNRKYIEKCKGCKFKTICGGYPILYDVKK